MTTTELASLVRAAEPGGVFHVYTRGDNREAIVRDLTDREALMKLIARMRRRHPIRVLARAILDNHLHLVVASANLIVPPIQGLLRTQAWGFNRRHGRTGHVFGRPFGRRRLATLEEVRRAALYVHLNPVKHGLSADPARPEWTGHAIALGEAADDGTIDRQSLLAAFGRDAGEAVRSYRVRFEESRQRVRSRDRDWLEEDPADGLSRRGDLSVEVVPERSAPGVMADAVDRLAAMSARLGEVSALLADTVRSPSRDAQSVVVRDLFCCAAQRIGGIPVKPLARWLGRTQRSVWDACQRGGELWQRNTPEVRAIRRHLILAWKVSAVTS